VHWWPLVVATCQLPSSAQQVGSILFSTISVYFSS